MTDSSDRRPASRPGTERASAGRAAGLVYPRAWTVLRVWLFGCVATDCRALTRPPLHAPCLQGSRHVLVGFHLMISLLGLGVPTSTHTFAAGPPLFFCPALVHISNYLPVDDGVLGASTLLCSQV